VWLAPASAPAQTVTASVTGSVRDASEAVIPGATVEIRKHETGQVWQAPIVIITMEPIYSLLPRMRNIIYGNIEGEKEYTLKFEHDIIEAVQAKDADKAYKNSVDLLERNREIYDKYYKETI
jgi:hypothetical protein